MDELQQLREENAHLRREIAQRTRRMLQAFKDRAEIHARLRAITSSTSSLIFPAHKEQERANRESPSRAG